MESPIDILVDQATVIAVQIITMKRGDGSVYKGPRNYGSVTKGNVRVCVVPVRKQSSNYREHFRATFYIRSDRGSWRRSNRIMAERDFRL